MLLVSLTQRKAVYSIKNVCDGSEIVRRKIMASDTLGRVIRCLSLQAG